MKREMLTFAVGRLRVYWNWFRLDPWFLPRFLFKHFMHPRSPLSSTALVHRAFFSPEYATDDVRKFQRLMPEYESLIWPSGMMFRFVNVRNVLSNIVGWEDYRHERVLIVAGEKDTLMGVELMRRMAAEYRQASLDILRTSSDSKKEEVDVAGNNKGDGGVGFAVIPGSGHHIQNDLSWEESADKIISFLDQL